MAFKMKGSPMQRNFPGAFRKDEGYIKKDEGDIVPQSQQGEGNYQPQSRIMSYSEWRETVKGDGDETHMKNRYKTYLSSKN